MPKFEDLSRHLWCGNEMLPQTRPDYRRQTGPRLAAPLRAKPDPRPAMLTRARLRPNTSAGRLRSSDRDAKSFAR